MTFPHRRSLGGARGPSDKARGRQVSSSPVCFSSNDRRKSTTCHGMRGSSLNRAGQKHWHKKRLMELHLYAYSICSDQKRRGKAAGLSTTCRLRHRPSYRIRLVGRSLSQTQPFFTSTLGFGYLHIADSPAQMCTTLPSTCSFAPSHHPAR